MAASRRDRAGEGRVRGASRVRRTRMTGASARREASLDISDGGEGAEATHCLRGSASLIEAPTESLLTDGAWCAQEAFFEWVRRHYYVHWEGSGSRLRNVTRRLSRFAVSPSRVHSLTTKTSQWSRASEDALCWSRILFAAIFGPQYAVFVRGLWPLRQSCPCQKQP